MLALQLEAARRGRFPEAFLCVLAESGFLALASAVLMALSERSRGASLFGLGILVWAIALLVHRTAHLRRIFRLAREAS